MCKPNHHVFEVGSFKGIKMCSQEIECHVPLLPCPFCGGAAYLSMQAGHPARMFPCNTYSVACRCCAASGPWEKNPEGPPIRWNTRIPDPEVETSTKKEGKQ